MTTFGSTLFESLNLETINLGHITTSQPKRRRNTQHMLIININIDFDWLIFV